MGSFYTNITLRTEQQPKVVETLRAAGRKAYVSPPMNGCVVVYDHESEDQSKALNKLAGSLSAKLKCAALAVLIHDDDLLVYGLFQDGKLTDEYVSWPALFDDSASESPEGGDAEILARAFGAESKIDEIESVLRETRAGNRDEGIIFESERHGELVAALGIPTIAVSTGYNYIEQGELPEGTTEESFTRVG